jgi:hypothetical protein
MYLGPPIDDPEILARLPAEYAELLTHANGYVYRAGSRAPTRAFAARLW